MKNTRATRNSILFAVLISSFCASGLAYAQAHRSECDAVLMGDLFNKVVRANSKDSSARTAIREIILKGNEAEAWDAYKKEHETAIEQGQKVSADVSYFPLDVNVKGDFSYEREISREDFRASFRRAKETSEAKHESSNKSNTAVASSYVSHIRDGGSIEAWKACVTKDPKTGLYAFGSRDASDNPSINVLWSPGQLASAAPVIAVEILAPNRDIRIESGKRELAIGSGWTIPVDAGDNKKGFSVIVNGEVRGPDGRNLGNFTEFAIVPPAIDAAAVANAALGCAGAPNYPIGRWKIDIIPPRRGYSTFANFTSARGGTWLPTKGSGTFDVNPALVPGNSVVLTFVSSQDRSYSSTNTLVVSPDGCSMRGTFLDVHGNAGEVSYQWESRQ